MNDLEGVGINIKDVLAADIEKIGQTSKPLADILRRHLDEPSKFSNGSIKQTSNNETLVITQKMRDEAARKHFGDRRRLGDDYK